MKLFNNLKKENENNQMKIEFLSGISHKVRTPLHAIIGYTESLLEEDLNKSSKEKAENILSSSQELLNLINGMIDISKAQKDEIILENRNYHPIDLIRDVVSYVKKNVNESNISVSFEISKNLPYTLYGDDQKIKEVLIHLCNNAIKYTNIGYIKIKVESTIKKDKALLSISIEDSGIGIKEENYHKIFSKFDRIGTKDEVNTEGIGLGLAVSKKIISLMNGNIYVDSIYQKGSKFTIELEQKIIEKEEVIELLDLEPVKFKNKKILIVDDNSLNLKVATLLLQKYEVDIDKVMSGKEAIQKIIEGNTYDLIFMDDMMPEMSGVETLHKLKMKPSFHIPTVALTANAVNGARNYYLEEGFEEYLSKPINRNELEKVLTLFLK